MASDSSSAVVPLPLTNADAGKDYARGVSMLAYDDQVVGRSCFQLLRVNTFSLSALPKTDHDDLDSNCPPISAELEQPPGCKLAL